MPALHRAVTLEQMNATAVRIREYLDLDVPRLGQILLEQHAIVPEACLRFAPRCAERRGEGVALLDDAHTLAPAAGGRLDQHRVADRLCMREQRGVPLVRAVIPRHDGNTGVGHDRLGLRLRAHRPDRGRRRADEGEPGRGERGCEGFVLGQEAIARMNRLRTTSKGNRDDRLAVEIACSRRCRAQPIRFIA